MKDNCPSNIAAMKPAMNVTRGTSWKKRFDSPSAPKAHHTMDTTSAWSTSSTGLRLHHSRRGRSGCAVLPRHQLRTHAQDIGPEPAPERLPREPPPLLTGRGVLPAPGRSGLRLLGLLARL